MDTKHAMMFAVVLVALGFVGGSIAEGHAKLASAEPAAGSTVAVPPKLVQLRFTLTPNEELDVQRSAISVLDSRARRVDDGKGGVDLDDLERRTMIARLKPIGPGAYTVRWKAVSSPDLDVAQGSYKFTVAATTGGMKLPPLRIVSPKDGAVVSNPVVIILETAADLSKMTMRPGMKTESSMATMPHLHIDLDRRSAMPTMKHLTKVGPKRYRYSFGTVQPGRHAIRVYWADAKHHKAMGTVQAITITVR